MSFEDDIKSIERRLFDLEAEARDLDVEGVSRGLQRTLETISSLAQRIKDHLKPKPWARLQPYVRSSSVVRIVRRYRKAQEEGEEVPIKVGIADNIYTIRIINGDEWTLFKNGEKVYATSDDVSPYVLSELFLAMMQDWARIEEVDGRTNPGDLIDKVVLEVLGASLAEAGTVVHGESNDKLKEIISDLTGREWNVREV